MKLVRQEISHMQYAVGEAKTSYQDENIQNIADMKHIRTKKCINQKILTERPS